MLHHARGLRQVLADPQTRHAGRDRTELAAHLCRSARLQVDRVDVAGTSIIKEQDARADRPLTQFSKLRPGRCARLALGFQRFRQCQAQRPQAADPQKFASIEYLVCSH